MQVMMLYSCDLRVDVSKGCLTYEHRPIGSFRKRKGLPLGKEEMGL